MKVESPVLPATAMFWQPRPRRVELVVVVKASFEIASGSAVLAAQQEPLVEYDQHWNDDPSRFLVATSDLVPAKRGVDVVYVGRLLGPGGGRMRVGSIDKPVEARADRWTSLGPMVLDRRASPEAALWARAWPTAPMPDGVSVEIFNAAPPDQRLAELAPGAEVQLDNLAPLAGLRFRLPPLSPSAEAELGSGRTRVPLRVDTLAIDGERGVASLVWRGTLEVEGPSAVRGVTIALERSSQEPPLGRAGAPAAPLPSSPTTHAPPQAQTARTALPSVDPFATDALPFRQGSEAHSPYAIRPANQGASSGTPWGTVSEAQHPLAIWGTGSAPAAAPRGAPPAPAAAAPVAPPAVAPPAPLAVAPPAPPAPAAAQRAAPPAPVAVTPTASVAVPLAHAASAAFGGVATASDAAIAATAIASSAGATSAPIHRGARTSQGRGIRLLWHDEEALLRIRNHPRHKPALRKRERIVAERRHVVETPDAEDAAEVLCILQEVDPTREVEFGAALERGFDDEGRFEADIVRIDGVLHVALDETELLAALVSTMAPYSKEDARVGTAVEAAAAFLEAARRVSVPEVAHRLAESLRLAWGDWGGRPMGVAEVDELASRAVLERRSYRKKHVLGGMHLRATMTIPGSATSQPAYLPESCAKSLPLFLRFGVRALCEVHPREDATEASPSALRVVALARALDDPSMP
jgi:hypothetical protein